MKVPTSVSESGSEAMGAILQVKVLKELGVQLKRDRAPKKRNLHRVLRKKLDIASIRGSLVSSD